MRNRLFWAIGLAFLLAGCSDETTGASSGGDGGDEGGGGTDVPTATCGNSKVESGEACDDGNTSGGDGCAADCKTVETGYTCPPQGGSCKKQDSDKPAKPNCGNGTIDNGEACDDGNTADNDGCSADCSTIEPQYTCPDAGGPCIPADCGNNVVDENEECDAGDFNLDGFYGAFEGLCGKNCKPVHFCGDGLLDDIDRENGEECDGGSNPATDTRDGCTYECKRVNYCGDGIIQKDEGEECDDGNDADNDGCSASCIAEPGFTCIVEQGKSVCSAIACGNGKLEPDKNESCDDGNRISGDGCSSACQMEKGFRCTTESDGKTICDTTCGNAIIDSDVDETCDDGNNEANDGCSAFCVVEAGYVCPNVGKPCFARACGDGIVAGNEECDDGNAKSNDGCSNRCKREEGYACREPNQPCVRSVCGDGIVEGDETCDEGADTSKHTAGCVDCQVQMGWQCLTPGDSCTQDAVCGNGKLEGAEECDEGNAESGSTITAGCVNCIITTGWRCPDGPAAPCIQGACGDGELDKGEQCDDGTTDMADGKLDAGDGCSPICEIEPVFDCNAFGCMPMCGDGLVIEGNEECDDGNLVNGDGCSSECKIESGFTCEVKTSGTPDVLDLPIVYHDFPRYLTTAAGSIKEKPGTDGYLTQELYDKLPAHCKPDGAGHSYRHSDDHSMAGWSSANILKVGRPSPDFLSYCPGMNCPKAVLPKLGKDGTPDLASYDSIKANSRVSNGGIAQCAYLFTCPEVFKWWYNDVPGINKRIEKTLRFYKMAGTTNDYQTNITGNFLPLGAGEGYGASESDGANNGEFTSHFQTYFKYKGDESLEFSGDDDVWVFFNGYLGVDVGGIHGEESRTVTLRNELKPGDVPMYTTEIHYNSDGSPVSYSSEVRRWDVPYAVNAAEQLHMYPGGIYAIDMFHAERCLGGSNYKMTLRGFVSMGQSTCDSICGDGLIRGAEECDPVDWISETDPAKQAELKQKAVFDGCTTACKLQPHCGNSKIEKGEQCDTEAAWCDNCMLKYDDPNHRCGDGIKQEHEECDGSDGVSGAQICLATCRISGCPDGIVDANAGEECDDGNEVDDDNCTNACKRPICGDGITQKWLGEACDDGKNDGSYGGCGLGCSFIPPRCGDGIIDELNGEECDDGINSGAYNTCDANCKNTARCGDGIIQEEFETCDDGDKNGTDGYCSKECRKSVN